MGPGRKRALKQALSGQQGTKPIPPPIEQLVVLLFRVRGRVTDLTTQVPFAKPLGVLATLARGESTQDPPIIPIEVILQSPLGWRRGMAAGKNFG